jgi:hypothetical protein
VAYLRYSSQIVSGEGKMLDRIHKIAEIVAAFAIVGSLVFVGMQMQQNTSAIRSSAAQANSDSWQNLTLTMANNPKLAELWAATVITPENFEGQISPELLQIIAFISANTKSMETNYHQWLSGNLSDELFSAARSGFVQQLEIQPLMEQFLTVPGMVAYTDSFTAFVQEALAEAKANRARRGTTAE